MVWIQLIAYVAASGLGLTLVLEAFGFLLRPVARLPRAASIMCSLLLYGLVAAAFFLALLGVEFLDSPSIDWFRDAALLGYLLSGLVAVLIFRRRHLSALRALGYFRQRSDS